MHFNLLDRESQIACVDVDVDALKLHEVLKPWRMRNNVQEVFGRRCLTFSDGT